MAGELEDELAEARALAVAERIAARAAPEPNRPQPEAPVREVIWVSPQRPEAPTPAPTESPTHFARPDAEALSRVMWLGESTTDDSAPPPSPTEPAPPPPVVTAEAPAPAVAATAPPAPPVDIVSAAGEIADLLRATHDNAVRLRSQAEVEVRHTVQTTRAELVAEQHRQLRELSEERELAERETARMIHDAELESLAIRQRGQQDADAARAAAAAVQAQAKAEIGAVKALAHHNLAAIDAAREDAIAQSREMLALGRGMLQTVFDLDRECDARLVHSRRVVAELMRTRAG